MQRDGVEGDQMKNTKKLMMCDGEPMFSMECPVCKVSWEKHPGAIALCSELHAMRDIKRIERDTVKSAKKLHFDWKVSKPDPAYFCGGIQPGRQTETRYSNLPPVPATINAVKATDGPIAFPYTGKPPTWIMKKNSSTKKGGDTSMAKKIVKKSLPKPPAKATKKVVKAKAKPVAKKKK